MEFRDHRSEVRKGDVRNLGLKWALKARIATRIGASGVFLFGETDLGVPELVWRSSARQARGPLGRLRKKRMPKTILAEVRALSGHFWPEFFVRVSDCVIVTRLKKRLRRRGTCIADVGIRSPRKNTGADVRPRRFPLILASRACAAKAMCSRSCPRSRRALAADDDEGEAR